MASPHLGHMMSDHGADLNLLLLPLKNDVLVVGVECYAGYRADEAPRRFTLGTRQIEIAAVVDRWLAPDYRYFKVRDRDGNLYILRHDVASTRWELTSFRRSDSSDGRADVPHH